MNPLKWFRWKIVAILVVLLGAFYFFGLDPLALSQVNDLGSGEVGARWNVKRLDLGFLSGAFDFNGVRVATGADRDLSAADERVFSADKIHFGFDMGQALRKRFHGALVVEVPRLRIERRPDGSINVGDIGEEPEKEEPAPETKPTDWAKSIREWFERLKKIQEKVGKREPGEEGEGRRPPEGGQEGRIDTSRRVTYPYRDVARYVARRVSAEGFEIEFVDQKEGGVDAASGEGFLALTEGKLEVSNLSEKPSKLDEPIGWVLSGKLAGAPVELSGTLDLRTLDEAEGGSLLKFKFGGTGLPAALANRFARTSLPIRFQGGELDLVADIRIESLERLDIRPIIGFREVTVQPREGVRKIAGFDADVFCRAFNEAGTFRLEDLRLGGTFSDPEVQIGDSLKQLVVSGGKAFAKKQLDKGLEKGAEEVKKQLDKVLDGKLEKAGGSKLLEDLTGRGVQENVDNVKEGLGSGLKGLLGGQSSEDKTKAPEGER